MSNTKQVLVIRKDLNMRKGKIAAQCCHGSMSFLTKDAKLISYNNGMSILPENQPKILNTAFFEESEEINHWLKNSFRKIVCYVESEQELDEIHQKALDKGLISHMVVDNGATEFNGIPTKTCVAIGPAWDENFEGITDHLPLL